MGLTSGDARHLMLSTASLSIVGYEHTPDDPAVILWNDVHHVNPARVVLIPSIRSSRRTSTSSSPFKDTEPERMTLSVGRDMRPAVGYVAHGSGRSSFPSPGTVLSADCPWHNRAYAS